MYLCVHKATEIWLKIVENAVYGTVQCNTSNEHNCEQDVGEGRSKVHYLCHYTLQNVKSCTISRIYRPSACGENTYTNLAEGGNAFDKDEIYDHPAEENAGSDVPAHVTSVVNA